VITPRLSLALAPCFLAILASAQTAYKHPGNATGQKLVSIHVSGTQRYTQDEIIAATGLKIGASATEDDFQKVAHDLGETGLFTDISFSYAHSPVGTKLDLQLTDNDKLIPTRFDNFVWFSDDALIAKIRESIPLFKGEVSVGGDLSDQVSDVLQAILLQHSPDARANYIRENDGPDGPIRAVNFRAAGLNIRIRKVSFPGASSDQEPALLAAARNLQNAEYLRSEVALYVKSKLLPVYLERGFLKAAFAPAQTKVAEEDPDVVEVDVALPVIPGPEYKVSNCTWQGNSAFPASRLQSLVHLTPGQSANTVQLKADLEEIHKLYGTRGYMTAQVKPDPTYDEATATVSYTFQVNEGDLFHLGDLEFQGVDSKTADRLREAWSLRERDPYDSSYARRFVERAWKLLPSNLGWTVSIQEAVNENDKTVDLTVRYAMKPDS
jgi:outer membrane protein assembly factor BamA